MHMYFYRKKHRPPKAFGEAGIGFSQGGQSTSNISKQNPMGMPLDEHPVAVMMVQTSISTDWKSNGKN